MPHCECAHITIFTVLYPTQAITFNRSARELFDFMARIMRAKKKLARQELSEAAMPDAAVRPPATPRQDQGKLSVPFPHSFSW